jgi:oligopeptide/dipeptide ABC transporter ATP-binding protein
MNSSEKLLEVEGLKTHFFTDMGVSKAVDGVSFSVSQGDTVGIVGESGCGKSVSALSILRLIPEQQGKIVSGKIFFEDRDLLELPEREMRRIRGNEISMIFQDPMTSLNPVFTIGEQIAEVIRLHQGLSFKEALDKSIEMLELVRIPSPRKRVYDYPHQLSGGMRQRVMIAMALSCRPKLMLADEPTTALDVTIQAQILDTIQSLKDEIGTSIILITHDLSVIAENVQSVIVMYAGKIMEYAMVEDLFDDPRHPYTEGLLESIPRLDKTHDKLPVIPGIVPSPMNIPAGCKFNDRCGKTFERCFQEEPPLFNTHSGTKCRCWLYE